MKVTVADYDIGNLLSVERALAHCGAKVTLAKSPEDILSADRLVVPGVGAFKKCMEAVESHNIKEALIEFAKSGKPYLGICVGMQMLMEKSHEFGEHDGLGLIEGEVCKIQIPGERVPFVGWKKVDMGSTSGSYYFVHSYQAKPKNKENIIGTYLLGGEQVVAAVKVDNVFGVQFHPEKSASCGFSLLEEFLKQ